MLKRIKGYLQKFRPASEEQRMVDYLSQAQSREHLEHLEREWFKKHRNF